MENNEKLKTGTTTVGILGKDFVVLAADKRATAGHFIAMKNSKKVVPINEKIAVTKSGSVADSQLLIKVLRSELKIRDIRNGRDSTVKEAASILTNMIYQGSRSFGTMPVMVSFLLGGYDKKPSLYEAYIDGSIMDIKDEGGFISTGSGSLFALGVLENEYKEDLNEDEAIKLAVKAIKTAIKRDSASGQGIDVAVINKDGYKEVLTKKISEKLE